ncbi:MAG TPA: GIY-YIG nuclease family protein [Patescibacteria group bacterium]|nr:GIY-YIG nuclease family protein [Patescibacteria group bacterium]
MFYVYLLKSLKDNKYYIGQTENINKRLMLHNKGKVISTKNRIPLKLIGFKTFETRNNARWFEYQLKNHSDKKYNFIKSLEVQ